MRKAREIDRHRYATYNFFDSGSRFARPSTKGNVMDVQQKIRAEVNAHPVVLFMKGTADFPQCGFSANAIQILNACGVPDVHTVNVLDDPEVRQGIKEFANWPTIPQLYVRGEFVGGADIMREMYQSGELQKLLQG